MNIEWEVEDGYVGKGSPQYTDIPDEELDYCDTREEMEELIEAYVQEDFDQNITWSIQNLDDALDEYERNKGK